MALYPQAQARANRSWLREQNQFVRRGALYHPGLPTALLGVIHYCFAPPGLVIVQVDL